MSMFYDLIGNLLVRGGEALRDRHGGGAPGDERTEREFRQIGLLMRRVGAIWPDLFTSLSRESAALGSARDQVFTLIERSVPAWTRPPVALCTADDPLRTYKSVLRDLDGVVDLLHEYHEEPWASEALCILRRGMAEAADIQGELVDRALSV
jgi:hypothetical protein